MIHTCIHDIMQVAYNVNKPARKTCRINVPNHANESQQQRRFQHTYTHTHIMDIQTRSIPEKNTALTTTLLLQHLTSALHRQNQAKMYSRVSSC